MTLTPTLKFIVIALAFTFGLGSEFFTEIAPDLKAIGMSEPVYNIVSKLVDKLGLGALALVTYLGLKSPTTVVKEKVVE